MSWFKKIARLLIVAGIGPGAGLALMACTTMPSVVDQYKDLDPESKKIYLAHYPDLTSEQRKIILEHPESPELLLKAWDIDRRAEVDQPREKILGALAIEPVPAEPMTTGEYLDLHAFLNYRDGRKFEVGDDIRWRALPTLAYMDGHVLRFGCAYADVTVTANFYDERETAVVYELRKPVRHLLIRLAESSQAIDNSEFVKLNVYATCEDGTETEVSCQTSWSASEESGRITGCGDLQVSDKKSREAGVALVTATYGNKSVTQRVNFPPRKR